MNDARYSVCDRIVIIRTIKDLFRDVLIRKVKRQF